MRLGVVGATGLVGQHFLKLLEAQTKEPAELRLFARSEKTCFFKGKPIKTQKLEASCFKGLDICFFSAGSEVSLQWAAQAQAEKVIVIDNSSAFRRDSDKLLIVPEVNAELLNYKNQIIANPNCSTIQLVLGLYPLHKAFGLEEVRVVSLQSISGAGRAAVDTLKTDTQKILEASASYETESLEHAFNCVPHIGPLLPNGFCEEEEKIIYESKKILQMPDLKISAFTVRVPTLNSHSEVIWFSLKNPPASAQDIESALAPYVHVYPCDDLEKMPHGRQASGKKGAFAGRLHQDGISKNSWVLWLVADNLLKGASLNGLQIAQKLWDIK